MSGWRYYTVEVLEWTGDAPRSMGLVEMVRDVAIPTGRFELRREEAHEAIIQVIRGNVGSAYGQNHTRYGYRAYQRGKAGKHKEQEVLIAPR